MAEWICLQSGAAARDLLQSQDTSDAPSLVASFECIGTGKDMCDMTPVAMRIFSSRALAEDDR